MIVRVVLVLGLTAVASAETDVEAEVRRFIAEHVAVLQPLADQSAAAYWEGATTGRPEAFEKRRQLDVQIARLYQDRAAYERLRRWRDSGAVQDPLLRRQLEKLTLAYLKGQVPPDLAERIVTLDTRIQEVYNNYRPRLDGKALSMSDIYTALTTETDSVRRERVWRASKEVGSLIAPDLLTLVRLRNQAARAVGFPDYYHLAVTCGEQSVEQINTVFAELERLTEAPFARMKRQLDETLARTYGVEPNELMPWHYHDPFFQRTPLVDAVDLDRLYANCDIKSVVQRYYAGIGLPIDDILARSDLYDREGKYPHAFSFEADREGDVRVLCNLQNTERWAETALHELGHAVYSKVHDRSLPWLLREPAHAFTTEAVAMFFGRLSRNPDWMQRQLGLSDEQTARCREVTGRYLRFQQILFARWAAVMVHFEQALYADPNQDLNDLWWDLVERYQLLRRPPGPADAGWASKLHFTTAPCYYHNYLLGELLASQFDHTLKTQVLADRPQAQAGFCDDPRIGEYFRTRVFGPAARFRWDEMVRRATGEPLTARRFVEQFVR